MGSPRRALVVETGVTWNYATVLNIVFLALAAALVWRAGRTGGFGMLWMMNAMPADTSPSDGHRHGHG
jgi:uncharacterized protein